jgi:hypothetical protein
MNERDHKSAAGLRDHAPAPSAVRVIPAAKVPGALAAADRTATVEHDAGPSVLRPEQFDDLTDVVDHLRAGNAVLLMLDSFADAAERRRASAFVSGAAYALDITVRQSSAGKSTILLDPCASENRNEPPDDVAHDVKHRTRAATTTRSMARDERCVLCDLRTADREFEPPLEMVIKRNGSRIWSPPALVCSHCRATIRHWRFALAWCSECERWGRRNVVSPCGQLYG